MKIREETKEERIEKDELEKMEEKMREMGMGEEEKEREKKKHND